jgi:hypothetical protein
MDEEREQYLIDSITMLAEANRALTEELEHVYLEIDAMGEWAMTINECIKNLSENVVEQNKTTESISKIILDKLDIKYE